MLGTWIRLITTIINFLSACWELSRYVDLVQIFNIAIFKVEVVALYSCVIAPPFNRIFIFWNKEPSPRMKQSLLNLLESNTFSQVYSLSTLNLFTQEKHNKMIVVTLLLDLR